MLKVNDIPNIEYCTVESFGNPASAYRITANDGWCISIGEEPATSIIIPVNYDASEIQVLEITEEAEGD